MTRIAILGGGISGLTAAYELELARRRGAALDWQLYESTDNLGGIVQTTHLDTPEGSYILERGPDAWVTEKPWATDLAIELGLESELIHSNDATRKTYILLNGSLQPIPTSMRLMVPEDLTALEASPLFSAKAKAAYALELTRADELRTAAPTEDESIATFVLRHFGPEVLSKLAAPLLSGVFGGDVARLSVRAVMPQFVQMEREHGSLIAALQAKSSQRQAKPQPIFTSLRNGMASLTEALIAKLPQERIFLRCTVEDIWDDPCWQIVVRDLSFRSGEKPQPLWVDRFDEVFMCTPLDTVRRLLPTGDFSLKARPTLPTEASSAILATFIWPASLARSFTLPMGFGFLVPPKVSDKAKRASGFSGGAGGFSPLNTPATKGASAPGLSSTMPQLLAATFVDQKFPHRAPAEARILRAFFGGSSAEALASQPDATIAAAALNQLRQILGPIPDPTHTEVHRLPRSLPQYEVGHLDRMAQLDALIAELPGLHLLGNAYRGVGLPDLIRHARAAARNLIPNP